MTRPHYFRRGLILLAVVTILILVGECAHAAHVPLAADNAGAIELPQVEVISRTAPTTLIEPDPTVTPTRRPTATPKPTAKPTPKPTAKPTTKTVQRFTASVDDIRLFERVVAAEAGAGWPYQGVAMIAQVTVNQIGRYGSTLRAVLTKPGNYQVLTNGRVWRVTVTPVVRQAVADVLAGKTVIPRDVIGYCTIAEYNRPGNWHRSRPHYATYRNVVFVR